MKKFITHLSVGLLCLFLVHPANADHPSKDIGVDYPNATLWGDTAHTLPTTGASVPYQAVQGDIDGNGVPDLIFVGAMRGTRKRYVSVFFDASFSSLNNRNFQNPDFLVVTAKSFPWASDVVKFHPMHWIAVADLNQDGFDDIIFGLPIIELEGGVRDEKGEVYIVLGNTTPALGFIRDFSIDPPDFTFFGNDAGDRAGFSVATGDVNGDGRKDILIGAPLADGPNNAFLDGGEVYVITRMDWTKSSMVLTRSNADLYIYGEAGRRYGEAVITGNINGDFDAETGLPIDDIIIAPKSGPVRMIYGKTSEKRLATSSDWVSGYSMGGRHPNLATGDINHDGIEDLIGGEAAERSYLTYGSADTLSISPDVTVISAHPGDRFDFSKHLSDFDGDGIDDLLILAPQARGQFNQYATLVGEAHIIWGQTSRLPSTINLATDPIHFSLYGSDGTGPTRLSSNFLGDWSSLYGYVFGMDLDGNGISELLYGGSGYQNTYIYEIGPGLKGQNGGSDGSKGGLQRLSVE